MMRKYRGKRKDNGEWITGGYIEAPPPPVCIGPPTEKPKHFIITIGFADWGMPRPLICTEVHKDSVAQSTGKHDKNGDEVFGGMRVKNGDFVGNPDHWRYWERVVTWDSEGLKWDGIEGDSVEIIPEDKE